VGAVSGVQELAWASEEGSVFSVAEIMGEKSCPDEGRDGDGGERVWRGALIWVVRIMALLPFLENGRLPVSAEEVEAKGGRLPESAEFFFSMLILAFTITILFACYQLFKSSGRGPYLNKGVLIAIFFLLTVTLIDLPISTFVAGRTLSQFFINVALDY